MMTGAASIRVWDIAVRLTHWSVAALVLRDLVEDSGGPSHRAVGYVAAGLVLFRILWGFIGSEPARFSAWLPTPSRLLAYLKALIAHRPPRYLSHTPLGAMMMITMWAIIIALAVTGWMSRLDAFWGEDGLKDVHELLADALMVLIVIHLIAAVAMSMAHKENLIAAMLTGNKRRDGGT
ncbi:cytochrome b/b6 domain-containing protein [Cupriavidus basilensis]